MNNSNEFQVTCVNMEAKSLVIQLDNTRGKHKRMDLYTLPCSKEKTFAEDKVETQFQS